MKETDSLYGKIVLGNYIVQERVGKGAMGIIYRGQHRVLGRQVAIKVLKHSLLSEEEEILRFRDEAEAIARLSHPNVVTILDFGTTEKGAPCIVTEFVAGETILEILDMEGPLEPWRAVSLIQQVLSALIEAHSMGIVHRDIKADNIMVSRLMDGREQVKLLDFGISFVMGQPVEEEAYICGTPIYMSPEQCEGQKLDSRTDLYSLGVVFFEILTGEPPFVFDDPYSYLKAHKLTLPPRPSQVADQPIPEALEETILKLLEKDPDLRFQSAEEVKQVLNQWEVSRVSNEKGITTGTDKTNSAPSVDGAEAMEAFSVVSNAVKKAAKKPDTRRVLLMEPDERARKAIGKALAAMGLDVDSAASFPEVYERIKSETIYDLWLLAQKDKSGPSSPGYGAIVSELLAADPLAEVIVLSEHCEAEDFKSKSNGWASNFLIRPFKSFKAFQGHILAALKRREANRMQADTLRQALLELRKTERSSLIADEIRNLLEMKGRSSGRLLVCLSEFGMESLARRGHRLLSFKRMDELNLNLQRRGLDVVVLDTTVSEMHMMEVVSQVVARRPEIELVLTGFTRDLGDLLSAVELGATDFILKPIEDIEVFVKKVELAVNRRRRRLRMRRLVNVLEELSSLTDSKNVSHQLQEVWKIFSETMELRASRTDIVRPTASTNPEQKAVDGRGRSCASDEKGAVRVLLLDDDQERASKVASLLSEARFPTLQASDFDGAIKILDRYEMDILIAELSLFLEATEQMLCEARPYVMDLPTLVYGDDANPESIMLARAYGATNFMLSPMKDTGALLSRIQALAGKSE